MFDRWFAKGKRDARRLPPHAGADHAPRTDAGPAAASRRQQRQERRARLYAVVREAMVRAGMLSSAYSFKVLSLEPHGRQYIIMVDLAREGLPDIRQQEVIEQQIRRDAKAQHDLLITAVYWRPNDRLKGVPRPAAMPAHDGLGHRFEPIGADEVAALQQALAIGMSAEPTAFQDTEVMVAPEYPALSRTQYGDLI